MKKKLLNLLIITLMFGFISLSAISVISQNDEEIIEQKKVANEPIKIVSINTDNGKIMLDKSFSKTRDWYKDLEIKIENVSDKYISYIEFDLIFNRPKGLKVLSPEDKLSFGQIISYGNKSKSPKDKIAPGDVAFISLGKPAFEALKSNLANLGYPERFKGVQIEVTEIVFADNTLWYKGVWSENEPKDTSKFIPIQLIGYTREKVAKRTLDEKPCGIRYRWENNIVCDAELDCKVDTSDYRRRISPLFSRRFNYKRMFYKVRFYA